MSLTNESDGTTNIHGPVVDQAALHSLLQKLRECTHRQELRRLRASGSRGKRRESVCCYTKQA